MSTSISTTPLCIPSLLDYEAVWGENNSPNGRFLFNYGTLKMLNSPIFTNGARKISDDVMGIAGKKRGVKMMFQDATCVAVCVQDYDCTKVKEYYSPSLRVQEFDLETRYTPCIDGDEAGLKVSKSEFEQWCQVSEAELAKETIMRFDTKVLDAIDKSLVTLLSTYINAGNVVNAPIVTFNTTTSQMQLNSQWELMLESQVNAAGYAIEDMVILAGQFAKLIDGKTNIPVFYDRYVDTVLANVNSFIAIPKGSFQLVTWLQNKSVGYPSTPIFERATKAIPLGDGTFVEFDYKWEWDTNCDQFVYEPSLWAELVSAVPGTCTSLTQNGVFKFVNCTNIIPATCA